ncbi:predicted protein [Coccidioides posadasii str. Silveira]|uniref:Predicted protein n=1 Tax=Coccidioides posadasii (strain RMSCC 757 / Silveira) TaxID=443226 RepID=E9DGD4_COCPS|nr:predicted protein [Coccidioides posadasii str. Silveira]
MLRFASDNVEQRPASQARRRVGYLRRSASSRLPPASSRKALTTAMPPMRETNQHDY